MNQMAPEQDDFVRGDRFLDAVLGWFLASMAAILFGVVIYKAFVERSVAPGVHLVRIALLLITMAGCLMVVKSTIIAFRICVALFGVRLAADLFQLLAAPRDRFLAMAVVFDAVMIGYAWFRIRGLTSRPV